MTIVLDYLYRDASPEVDDCRDVELLMNVLVVADQLLITRLRSICEVSIAAQSQFKVILYLC